MLREERVVRLTFDVSRDVLEVEADAALPASVQGKGSAVRLLLDTRGHLVGVDVGEEPSRVVVMAGRHEDVDRAVDADAEITGAIIRVRDAKRSVRAHEKNPYA